ncbi:MAG: hypothetical protein MR630_06810 [Selenomonas sp.]|uniref:hypothetical protein n=1 Tax=Selenomonas sp. TaxID=2053611 RepID=UPI0025FDE6A2|nr:hypothetical protein [Selenomonas sp.]MCI6232305.1 hypothetical protein [Selenomonas sp.]
MYYNTTTEIQLDDLAEALKEPGDENGVTAKAELDTIESLLKKNALAEIPTKIGIDGVLLHDVVKIVPSVDWIGKDAYLELTFHAGICESAQMVTATVTFPLHDIHVEKTDKSIRIEEALDRYPEIHLVEE